MATADSTRTPRKDKDFPLWLHQRSRYWCRKIRGKRHYFSKDKNEALSIWLAQKDDLLAGRKPRDITDGLSVRDACNHLLTSRQSRVVVGELSKRQFNDLHRACELVVEFFGRGRMVEDLRPDDFRDLREKLGKQWGASSLKREIANIRSIFNHAYKNDLVDRAVKFGTEFSAPTKKTLRKARQESGDRMFEVEQLRRLIDAATLHVMPMILLAVNGGLGNSDIAFLEQKHIDLAGGWLTYPRRKTGLPRRVKLWAETVQALRDSLEKRPRHKAAEHAGLVFVTKYGGPWGSQELADSAIGKEFRKLLNDLGIYRRGLSFYSLRHVYRTVADEVGDQAAIDYTMGHARDDMASVYRERISDERLERIADHVRGWLYGMKGS